MGKTIKFGYLKGPIVAVNIPAAATQAFKHLGGAFVKLDSSQRADIADSGDGELFGWAFTGEFTTSGTAGQTILSVNISLDALYLMPVDAARTEAELMALVGKTCDLTVSTNQYADYDEGNENVIQMVGYEYHGSALGEQALVVRMNPNKVAATSVT